jgi:hypothetical protein
VYFEEFGVIITLILLGTLLEASEATSAPTTTDNVSTIPAAPGRCRARRVTGRGTERCGACR